MLKKKAKKFICLQLHMLSLITYYTVLLQQVLFFFPVLFFFRPPAYLFYKMADAKHRKYKAWPKRETV